MASASSPPGLQSETVYRPSQNFTASVTQDDMPPVVIRAQNSPYYGNDGVTPPTYSPDLSTQGGTVPYSQTPIAPYQSMQPFGTPGVTSDPWVGGTPIPNAMPYGPASPGRYGFGVNGVQPYNFGWSSRYDYGVLENAGTSGFGGWGITEVDIEKELVTPIWNDYIFSFAPQFNYRSWEGPTLPTFGIHGSMYRLGLGLKLATPDYGGWSAEIGFNPGYATDFYNTDFADAMQYDGHAVLFWRMNPTWTWALGAAYWDRVDDIIVPYAGAVWTPNDTWEFRLVLPEPRITVFLGTPFGTPTWMYVRGEYHVESYAIETEAAAPIDTQIQTEDYRALIGLRKERAAFTTFVEVGWVFDRDFKFETAPAGSNGQITSGLIGQVGLRY